MPGTNEPDTPPAGSRPGAAAWFRPGVSLFAAMGLLLPCVAIFSGMTVRGGDLPGTDYFVFPFLRHGHGEFWRPFFPGSWAANFILPSWLLSVALNTLRRAPPRPLAPTVLFFYLWVPLTGIIEVAADTLVPVFTGRFGVPFVPLAVTVDVALAGAIAVAWLFARGSEGEW